MVSGTITVTLKNEFISFFRRFLNCLTHNTTRFGELTFDINTLPDIPEHKIKSVVYELFVFDDPKHIHRRRCTESLSELRDDLLLIQRRTFPDEWYSCPSSFTPQRINVSRDCKSPDYDWCGPHI